jgi:hypothetical protein
MSARFCAMIALILLNVTCCLANDPLPKAYQDKVDATPDFCQTDQRYGKFPGHGDELCAPVALSNTLIWLNHHGFPNLIPKEQSTKSEQADLIRLLCSEEYMKTDLNEGTPPKRVISGLELFLKSRGYGCKIEQMGWRSSVHRIGNVPDENWMLRSCMGNSNIVINVGWYKSENDTYKRLNGHWVTLVGYKTAGDKRVLLIHDPGTGSGNDKTTEALQIIPIPENRTLTPPTGQPIDANGYFQLKGIHLKRGADTAIIDGAIAFEPTVISEQ